MPPGLPNIILIVLDTVGAKHMSLYGYHRRTTPNLEAIAEECTVYNRCFAPACWTVPSHASMFTGLYPSQHGAHEGNFLLYDNLQHMTPVLKSMGYRTLGISANHLMTPATGLCPGFDYFKDFGETFLKLVRGGQHRLSKDEALAAAISRNYTVREKMRACLNYIHNTGRWQQVVRTVMDGVRFRAFSKIDLVLGLKKSPRYSEETIKLVQKVFDEYSHREERPFFLFINFMEAHSYYRPPLKYRRFSKSYDKQFKDTERFYTQGRNSHTEKILRTYENLYDDEIFYLDDLVYRIWMILKQSTVADNTVFIITSDHGEHFGEKGHYGHRLSLYNELIWVPLLVKFPHSLMSKGLEHRLVSLNDLYSTILDIIQCPLPVPESSISLLSASPRDVAIAQIIHPEAWRRKLRAMDDQDYYKVMPELSIITSEGLKVIGFKDGSLEVYDLKTDMAENDDLVPQMSDETLATFKDLVELAKGETGYFDEAQKRPKAWDLIL